MHEGLVNLWDECPDDEDFVRIELTFNGKAFLATSERGFFHAFCEIRKRLEALGVLPLCFAACKTVYPSGMISSMGCGEQAYKLTLGRQAKSTDLVDIFDSSDDLRPTTVEQQERFYEKWIQSL